MERVRDPGGQSIFNAKIIIPFMIMMTIEKYVTMITNLAMMTS